MNFSPWVILFSPFAAVLVTVLLTPNFRKLTSYISVAAVALSFVFSVLVFTGENGSASFTWIDLGSFQVKIGYVIDELTKLMLLVVTGVGLLIHIYSIGYMHDDRGRSRYFAGLSLFMFSMLGIVLANNFIMMFIFWELVGVSSYILIGHWFERPSAADAANKALVVNRIGDFGFMLGILMVWSASGTVMFGELSSKWSTLGLGAGYATIAAIMIFCGAVGKSAQFPLHVWLPDAMEGPTPVSALIHAATMVAAGVYLLVRVAFLIQASQTALLIIAWIGTITALLGALLATQQSDIKRILAYSTISQLGYMVMAVGLASNEAAMFHLFTHAFFKALLFLAAGSVIVSLHHEQNIWQMGGLASTLKITFGTFAVGALALIGCPPFSGFFSKDAILALAYQRNMPIFVIGLTTAFLTAFYVSRQVIVVFLGKPRSDIARRSHESPLVMVVPLLILAFFALTAGLQVVAQNFL